MKMKRKLFWLIPQLALLLVGCGNSNNGGSNVVPPPPVVEELGTLNNPYTVEQALAVIGTNTSLSTNEIFVKGIVNANPSFNSTYNSFSVYLVDKFGDSKNVQVYSATIDANAGYTDLQRGDTIVAGGHYMYYSQKSQP